MLALVKEDRAANLEDAVRNRLQKYGDYDDDEVTGRSLILRVVTRTSMTSFGFEKSSATVLLKMS